MRRQLHGSKGLGLLVCLTDFVHQELKVSDKDVKLTQTSDESVEFC